MTQEEALTILKTGANVFLTGHPGSGKTYTLNSYISYLRKHQVSVSVTASTGIAATHCGGITIHSFAGIGIKDFLTDQDIEIISQKEYVAKRIQNTHVLVIDEVSMLPRNVFEMVDRVCRAVRQREEPFGGLQVVLVGDFFQLPPISKNRTTESLFCFDSKLWRELDPLVCYLSTQYRTEDDDYLEVLNAIRSGTVDELHTDRLSQRVSEQGEDIVEDEEKIIPYLFSHNVDVDSLNNKKLAELDGIEFTFNAKTKGKDLLVQNLVKSCLSPETLQLKIGARVMCTKNNPQQHYVNGTLGVVVEIDSYGFPVIETDSGDTITIEPESWSVVDESGKVLAELMQIPLRLAWAITIHKSQGMSMECACIDLSEVFEFGQGYVALSRVRTLSGLHLKGFNQKSLQVHPAVENVDKEFQHISKKIQKEFSVVGPDKIRELHNNFLKATSGILHPDENLEKVAKKQVKKVSTYQETFELLGKGLTLSDISFRRGVKPGTIIDHLDHLIETRFVSKEQLLDLCDKELGDNIPTIKQAFLDLGSEKLKPVFESFKGRFSYDELKLVRLIVGVQ